MAIVDHRENNRDNSGAQGAGVVAHEHRVAALTGGLAPTPANLSAFAGSERLRPDGRPQRAFRDELRKISNARNAATVLAVLATPSIIAIVVAQLVGRGHWWAWLPGAIAMGTIFPRFYILNHEAAHRLLFSNRRWNDLIGEKLLGLVAFGDGSSGYRIVHSQHHRDEFGPREPDFGLYAQYPIERASLRRKLVRDGSGKSAWRIYLPVLKGLFTAGRRRRAARTVGPQLLIFGAFLAAGQPLMFVVLWLVPWATYWRVVNRLRSLAEHGGMTRSPDRRRTTHHVRQGVVARVMFVPFNTGYHLAHHVDSGIPFRNLPTLHRALDEDGYLGGVTVHPNYRSFWRTLVLPAQPAPAA